MIAAATLLLAGLGIIINLAFSGYLIQPDWSLALLLASLLAHRGAWYWVIPGAAIHDLLLNGSVWGNFPWMLLIPLLLPRLDFQLGPGLPQRAFFMVVVTLPLMSFHWPVSSWLLTLLLCVPLWYLMVRYYVRRV